MFEHKKSLGQNFIKNQDIINKIIDASNVTDKDLVIEIGPGMGVLSSSLMKKAKNLLCYEIDKRLKPYLDITLNQDNVTVKYQDFLESSLKEDIKDYQYEHLYIIANIPYYITTPIVNKIVDEGIDPDKIIIMIQEEVADRFCAKPGTKDYNSLTVFLNYHFDIEKLFTVDKENFEPKPKVSSAVISMSRKNNKVLINDLDKFYKLVKDSFQFKRKTLKNNLINYNLKKINQVLNKHQLDLTVRAENISLEIFAEISNAL